MLFLFFVSLKNACTCIDAERSWKGVYTASLSAAFLKFRHWSQEIVAGGISWQAPNAAYYKYFNGDDKIFPVKQ